MFKRLKRMLRCSCLSRERGNADYEYELLNLVNFISETSTTRQRIQTAHDIDNARQTIDQHTASYREKLSSRNTAPKPADKEPDFFQDMAPEIVPQTKVFIQSDCDIPTNFSRLQATILPAIGTDLEDWTDGDQPTDAWEELNDKHINNLIRERRKVLRAQQKRKVSVNSMENKLVPLTGRISGRRQSL